MNKYFNDWKALKEEMGLKSILNGLFASIVFTIFIIVPTVLIYLQIISMYYHRLLLWVILMTLTFIDISVVQLLLWKKALTLVNTDIKVDIRCLFFKQMIIHAVIILIIGLLFILIWIPSLQV